MENNNFEQKNNKNVIVIILITVIVVSAIGVFLFINYNKNNNDPKNNENVNNNDTGNNNNNTGNNNNNTGNNNNNNTGNYTYSLNDLKLKADSTLVLSEDILNDNNVLLTDNNKNEILVDFVYSQENYLDIYDNYTIKWNKVKELSQKLFDGGLSDNALKAMNFEESCSPGSYNKETGDFDFAEYSHCEDFKTYPINVIEKEENDNNNYYLYSKLVFVYTAQDYEEEEEDNEGFTKLCSDTECNDTVMNIKVDDYDPDYHDYEGFNFSNLKAHLLNEVKDLSEFETVKYTFSKTTGGLKAVTLIK